MSLLDDFEELCNTQDVGIFKNVLDETLKPILIVMDERYFKINQQLGELQDKIMNFKSEMDSRLTDMETKVEHDLSNAYDIHNTKLHNVWGDVLKLQNEIESIQLNLKK